jgi:HprK-related kinase B
VHSLDLRVGDWRVRIGCDSAALVARLRDYFRYFPGDGHAPDETVEAVDPNQPIELGLEFCDWPREGGKTGRKDQYADVRGGRVLRKVRTGMHFLVGPGVKLAAGPCLANHNQVVNFVNALYMNRMLARGYVLCHAAGVAREGKGLAIAAVSGGGKSTLALHLLGRGFSYVSNDRLLIRREAGGACMSGVPKLPRINPGTALNNARLERLVAPERRAQLAALETGALWEIEEKYDVFVDEHFDGARFELCAPLDALLVLRWDRRSAAPARCVRVDVRERPDVLEPVLKSPGPFCVSDDGVGLARPAVAPAPYVDALAGVPVYEIAGGVDFDRACAWALEALNDGSMPLDGSRTRA